MTTSSNEDQQVGEILLELKVDLFHSCCMNEECDGYHPGQDEGDDQALETARIAINTHIQANTKRILDKFWKEFDAHGTCSICADMAYCDHLTAVDIYDNVFTALAQIRNEELGSENE